MSSTFSSSLPVSWGVPLDHSDASRLARQVPQSKRSDMKQTPHEITIQPSRDVRFRFSAKNQYTYLNLFVLKLLFVRDLFLRWFGAETTVAVAVVAHHISIHLQL